MTDSIVTTVQLRADKELVPSAVRYDVTQEYIACLRPEATATMAAAVEATHQAIRDFAKVLEAATWYLSLQYGYQVTVITLLQQAHFWASLQRVPPEALWDIDLAACIAVLRDVLEWKPPPTVASAEDLEAQQRREAEAAALAGAPSLPVLPTQRRLRICINKHCRNKDLASYQIQKRAADEAMACFYHCSKCNTAFYE